MIKVKLDDLIRATADLQTIQRQFPKAYVSALNHAAKGARTEAARKVRESYHVKYGEVLKKIDIRLASTSRMDAVLRAKGRNTRLVNYRTAPTSVPARPPRMLKAAVRRDGGMKSIPGAFVTRVRGGHVGVFRRTAHARHKKARRGVWSQMPIEQLYGPSIPGLLNNPEVVAHVEKEARRRTEERLDHEVKRQVLEKVNLK